MKVSVQVVIEADGDTPTAVHEVFTLERGALGADAVGLRLDEAKELLSAVQASGERAGQGVPGRSGALP